MLRTFQAVVYLLAAFAVFIIASILYDEIYASHDVHCPEKEYREGYEIVFSPEDMKALEDDYVNDPNEYLYCLKGTKNGGSIKVSKIEKIETQLAEWGKATVKELPVCPKGEYIGMLHKHPPISSPDASDQDIYIFGVVGVPLQIIQYDKDKFNALILPYDPRELVNWNPVRVIV